MSKDAMLSAIFRENVFSEILNDTMYARPTSQISFFTDLSRFTHADPGVIFHKCERVKEFAELVAERYPTLRNLKIYDLETLVESCLVGERMLVMETKIPSAAAWEDIVFIANQPGALNGYVPGNWPYVFHLIESDLLGDFLDHNTTQFYKMAIPYIKRLSMNDSSATDRIYLIRRVMGILRIAYDLKNLTGKPPALEYWNVCDNVVKSITSLGYTHLELFKVLRIEKSFERDNYMNFPTKLSTDMLDIVVRDIGKDIVQLILNTTVAKADTFFGMSQNVQAARSWFEKRMVYRLPINIAMLYSPREVLLDLYNSKEAKIFDFFRGSTEGNPFVDLYNIVQDEDMASPLIREVVKWVYRHKQFWNSFQNILSSSGEVVPVHVHTLIETIVLLNRQKDNPLDFQHISVQTTPTEFMVKFKDIFTDLADRLISERIVFPECPFSLDTVTVEREDETTHQLLNELLTFQRIEDSVHLSVEGKYMGHCIGGYGRTMSSGKDWAFHVGSSVVSEGYTVHITFKQDMNCAIISQIRGRFNALVANEVKEEIQKQLNHHYLGVV